MPDATFAVVKLKRKKKNKKDAHTRGRLRDRDLFRSLMAGNCNGAKCRGVLCVAPSCNKAFPSLRMFLLILSVCFHSSF